VFIEFQPSGKRHPDTFAALWLQDLVDGEEQDFDLPIWRCDNSMRLSQNYITEQNYKSVPDIKIETIGRVKFRGRFKPGMDRDHARFVSDNDSRETFESWEACFAEGVRSERVEAEVPPIVQELHEKSLDHGRAVLAEAPEEDKNKWMAKDGTDWSGAFGKEPNELLGRRSGASAGNDNEEQDDDDDDDDDDDSDDTDLGLREASTNGGQSVATTSSEPRTSVESTNSLSHSASDSKNPVTMYKDYKGKSRDLHRKQRGLMQW
jgi:hypothetical protein